MNTVSMSVEQVREIIDVLEEVIAQSGSDLAIQSHIDLLKSYIKDAE